MPNDFFTMDGVKKKAKDVLKKNKGHLPQVMAEFPDGKIGIIILDFSDAFSKEQSRNQARKLVLENNVEHYFFISESWYYKPDNKKLPRMPSRDIDRKEALVISEFKKNGINSECFVHFSREKVHGQERIKFGEEMTNDKGECYSRWDFYIEDKETDKQFDKADKTQVDNFIKKLAKEVRVKYHEEWKTADTTEKKSKILIKMLEYGAKAKREQAKTLLEDTEIYRDVQCPECKKSKSEFDYETAVSSGLIAGPINMIGLGLKCDCGHIFPRPEIDEDNPNV